MTVSSPEVPSATQCGSRRPPGTVGLPSVNPAVIAAAHSPPSPPRIACFVLPMFFSSMFR